MCPPALSGVFIKTHTWTDLMLSLSATILSLSWKAQSRRHLATSASCVASFSSWDMASYCFLSISISLLARSMSRVAVSCFWEHWARMNKIIIQSICMTVFSIWCENTDWIIKNSKCGDYPDFWLSNKPCSSSSIKINVHMACRRTAKRAI